MTTHNSYQRQGTDTQEVLENIKKLGKIGSKVKVANGFARNYLLRNNKALIASKENLEIFEKRKEELNKKNNDIKYEKIMSFFVKKG